MSNSSDWYDEIAGEIRRYRDKFGEKAYKKYKLDLLVPLEKYKLDFLLRVAKRVDSFSVGCDECQQFRGEITKLARNLGDPATSTKEERKNHSRVIDTMTKHLQKDHKLVMARENVGKLAGMVMVFGSAFGVVIGVKLGNVVFGITFGTGIGLMIGAAIGASLDAKAEKAGRII